MERDPPPAVGSAAMQTQRIPPGWPWIPLGIPWWLGKIIQPEIMKSMSYVGTGAHGWRLGRDRPPEGESVTIREPRWSHLWLLTHLGILLLPGAMTPLGIIYILRWNGIAWTEFLYSSNSQGGISNSECYSLGPSLSIRGGMSCVAWNDIGSSGRGVYVRRAQGP